MSLLVELVHLCGNIWIVLLAVAAYLFYYWWAPPCKNFPPGVRGYPILGAVPFFGKYPMRVLAQWSRERYGPVFSVRFGRNDCVVITSYEILSKAYIGESSKYTNRPLTPLLYPVIGHNGYSFRPETAHWRIQRNFVKNKLNTLAGDKDEIEHRINTIAQMLVDVINSENGKPFDAKGHLCWALSNNIIFICFGKKFDRNDKRLEKLLDDIHNLFLDPETSNHLGLMLMYHSLEMFPPYKESARKFRKRFHDILQFVDEEISEKKKRISEDSLDFVDMFLKEKGSREGKDDFTDSQLRVALFELVFAGTDTSAAGLLWTLLSFLHFPQAKDKLYNEVHSFYRENPNEEPSMNHSDSLPYTMAFIQELSRFKTVAPFGNNRRTNEDVKLNGFNVPKGTTIISNIWAIHNDPELWDSPELFKPERHIGADGSFVYSKKIIPFSIGGRSCPGEKLARTMMFLFVVNLVKSLEFRPDPSKPQPPGLDDDTNGLIYEPIPYKLVASPIELY